MVGVGGGCVFFVIQRNDLQMISYNPCTMLCEGRGKHFRYTIFACSFHESQPNALNANKATSRVRKSPGWRFDSFVGGRKASFVSSRAAATSVTFGSILRRPIFVLFIYLFATDRNPTGDEWACWKHFLCMFGP